MIKPKNKVPRDLPTDIFQRLLDYQRDEYIGGGGGPPPPPPPPKVQPCSGFSPVVLFYIFDNDFIYITGENREWDAGGWPLARFNGRKIFHHAIFPYFPKRIK